MMPTSRIARVRQSAAGFTLIELLITVVVLAVLTALALPSFMDSIRKGRRAEAVAALAGMQQGQERWRSNNANYSLNLPDIGASSPTRPGGYYTLAAASASATGYEITADGSGSSQADDGQCVKLGILAAGGAISYGSCRSCSALTYTATDACWSR